MCSLADSWHSPSSRFTATVQRPPTRMSLEKGQHRESVDGSYMNFKSVVLNSGDIDSEDEFVNIVVPLLEKHADTEFAKSSVREILTRSAELRQTAEKKKGMGCSVHLNVLYMCLGTFEKQGDSRMIRMLNNKT